MTIIDILAGIGFCAVIFVIVTVVVYLWDWQLSVNRDLEQLQDDVRRLSTVLVELEIELLRRKKK